MKGRIDFRYDVTHEIVVATPHWSLESDEDIETWFAQYATYFARFGRRMDFIAVLDDFRVATAIGSRWGDYRARLLSQYTRLNYRVHVDKKVRLFVNTSGARHNVATFEASSVEEAVSAILDARRREGLALSG